MNGWLVTLMIAVIIIMLYFTVLPLFMHVARYCVRWEQVMPSAGEHHLCRPAYTLRGAYRVAERERALSPQLTFRVYDNWLGHYDLRGPDWHREVHRQRREQDRD